jgi:hypothetical protein
MTVRFPLSRVLFGGCTLGGCMALIRCAGGTPPPDPPLLPPPSVVARLAVDPLRAVAADRPDQTLFAEPSFVLASADVGAAEPIESLPLHLPGPAGSPPAPPPSGPSDGLPPAYACEPGAWGAGCSAGAGCHEQPELAFPASVHHDFLQLMAVDIARRTLLAMHPYAAKHPIVTLDVVVRPSGHQVHTYAKLQWRRAHWWRRGEAKVYESEVSASFVYHPDQRLLYDISYVDDAWLPLRNYDRASDVVAAYNEDFGLRYGTGLPPWLLSDRIDVLEPYPQPRLANTAPVQEPDPAAKSLRTTRRGTNVNFNQ